MGMLVVHRRQSHQNCQLVLVRLLQVLHAQVQDEVTIRLGLLVPVWNLRLKLLRLLGVILIQLTTLQFLGQRVVGSPDYSTPPCHWPMLRRKVSDHLVLLLVNVIHRAGTMCCGLPRLFSNLTSKLPNMKLGTLT